MSTSDAIGPDPGPAQGLALRPWIPEESERVVQRVAQWVRAATAPEIAAGIDALVEESRRIHDLDGLNLNPATNTMNPRAEALLGSGIGSRPSLGYPGAKYEMGLEAIEQIEIVAAELAVQVFAATHAEIRVASGAMANLYVFMACARAGDAIIVPPASIAGHVTHHRAGAAGLYGLEIHEAPIDAERYTIDPAALADLAERVRPRVITVGGSLNLSHHDVPAIRAIADSVGARVMFDAAHLSGLIAGGAWPNPLTEGAHVMTMSTYKSLAGPPSGLLVTCDAELAERIEAIAYPGLTANFDVAKSAALAVTLLDWIEHGSDYAATMAACAGALATALASRDIPIHLADGAPTRSHAFAVDAHRYGGGQRAAEALRRANLLTSAIGLPAGLDRGLRVGTNELVRWGAGPADMDAVADLVARALVVADPSTLCAEVGEQRRRFDTISYLAGS